MKFTEFESFMSQRGIASLAEIARTLNTTPQAVSNWKARDQVPYHIIAKLNQSHRATDAPTFSKDPQIYSLPVDRFPLQSVSGKDTINFSDILLTMAEQLKVIVLVPFIAIFITFTFVKFIQEPLYQSFSTILLPENKTGGLGGLAGLANQFGMNLPQGVEADLSSPSLFPELINSRTFAERILDKHFHTDFYGRELPLLAILTYGDRVPKFGRDTLIQQAMHVFQDMVSFEDQGSFSVLIIEAMEPYFAKELNKVVLNELQNLNRFFRSQHVSKKTKFIQARIESVIGDLERSEQSLKSFRQQNRQVFSPALQLEEERLKREVEIQEGIYLVLKQQLELSKIEEVQESSIIQVLDEPQVPLAPSNKNLKMSVLTAGILGILFGIVLGFIRKYLKSSDKDERLKLRRVRNFIKKKGKDIILDRRVSGLVSVLLLIGLPFYLGHKSQNPVYFGMYSAKLMLVNTVYVIVLIFTIFLFIYLKHWKNDKA